ncbi:MAG: lipoate--protein ligase family protein [Candidatus Omnitrophica bacterium]|nr:lipoate--protein ligase family protein [Candidatus Omnitrophota bacterium]
MILKDISFTYAQENISYDQTILELAEAGSSEEVLRFWESETYFVVLGRASKAEVDLNMRNISRDGIEVIRRGSGGGTVLQGPGCLNYSLVLAYERHHLLKNIRSSYKFILQNISASLNKIGIRSKFEGLSDLAVEGRKFSGNAQCRRRRYLLHHGTILYAFHLDKIERYINIPHEAPAYRNGRSHKDFLTNIKAGAADIKKAIASGWIDEFSCVESGGILFNLP